MIVEAVGGAELRRQAMPGLGLVAHRAVAALVGGGQELVGDVWFELGVVVACTRQEGPVAPADLILGEQGVAVDGRVREVTGGCQRVAGARGTNDTAGASHGQAGAGTGTQAGNFVLLDGGAISDEVFGVGNGKRLVSLGVEYPLAILVSRIAVTQHGPRRRVDLFGALVGLGDLVVQRPLDVVGQGAVQTEAVFQAKAFAGDRVVTGTGLVVAETASGIERAAHCAQLIGVAVVLVMLIGQAQARVVGVIPAQFGQHAGGASVLGVGFSTVQASAAGFAKGLCFMTVALTEMQQAIELACTAGDGAGRQPAVVGGAVAGFQARADILARFDDVVRVQRVVTDGAANGIAAVQNRGRAPEDLHTLDDFRVDIVAVGLGIGAVEETVGHLHAIDLGQHAVAIDAANVVAGDTGPLACAAYRNTGFVAHQLLDGIDVVAVQIFARVDRDRARYAVHILLVTRGADGHLLQVERAATTALFQNDAVVAQFAIAQVGPHQQAIQGFLRRQGTAYSRRGHTLCQLRRHADLPARHGGKGIECRHQ
ncbi:hypothetical protein D3C85_903220 [compost metagenome]